MAQPYVKTTLQCPCGEIITAQDEDELVDKANQHLSERHPDLAGEYTREQILFMAY
jgi:hypothetical protein